MRIKTLAITAALALLPSTSLKAQEDIVVTAIPHAPAELKKAVGNFVSRVGRLTEQAQMARRLDDYCPRIIGLDEQYEPIVLNHINQAAEAAGLPRAAPDCARNLIIVFTRDGDALTRELRRASPLTFRGISPEKGRELFDSGRPVRWFYTPRSTSKNGQSAVDGVLRTYSASIISTNIVIALSGTVVIIDVGKTEGFPLSSVSAYAAMVSFAQVSGNQQILRETPTILGMFNREGPRKNALPGLTQWDRAYLRSLYAIRMDRNSDQQRRALSGMMSDELAKLADAPQN